MDELFRQAVYLRMGERLVLTAVIVGLALVVSAGFWKSLQKLQFSAEKSVGLSGNVVLATPVLVLLALVGYAWVTLNAPVTVSAPPLPAPAGTQHADVGNLALQGGEFTAIVETDDAGDMDINRVRALEQLRSLNCLARRAAATEPLSPRLEDDFAAAKLALIGAVWDPDWGDYIALADWAMGFTDAIPGGEAQRLFDDIQPVC